MKKAISILAGVVVLILLIPWFAVAGCNGVLIFLSGVLTFPSSCVVFERSGLSGITYPGSWPVQGHILIAALAGLTVGLFLWRIWAKR